ncbi:3-methyladenine DNA glycosylase [Nakamurella deserti]|uniref:3-methyladenine DNA glycosylase n=1 Tax=Nakamurella deserti TaxID=2164074 RepID=UPI00197C89AA|nr:3-methyladenine DNA glycosylase [Nakamurella deserti]
MTRADAPDTDAAGVQLWEPARWRDAQERHRARVDEITAAARARSAAGVAHPVEDFLFTYYRMKPGQLRHWHPGAGVGLRDAPDHAAARFYRTSGGVSTLDPAAFCADRGATLSLVRSLLTATAAATPQFGCFGLHEWAMVHRQTDDRRRHTAWPLRLGQAGTDEVVAGAQLRCTHFDAFRFFTPAARPLNLLQPTVDSRVGLEQPGCLHASMDLYKWAYKMLPAVSSEFVLTCFRLARDVRELDMRASPYDLRDLGYVPVPIETAAGKAEYVAGQRAFAARAAVLRAELLTALSRLD